MRELLPPGPVLGAFVAVSFVLAITPGPGVFYIVTRSLAQGRRAGLASVAGVALGNLGNATGAALGLGALFALSTAALAIVRYAGALYLIFLGIRALRVPPARDEHWSIHSTPIPRVFRDGFIVALLNPKTALFFAAFLPQFMGPTTSVGQSLVLGSMFVMIAATTDTAYAWAAGTLAPRLARMRGAGVLGRYASGVTLIGLGVSAALAKGCPSK